MAGICAPETDNATAEISIPSEPAGSVTFPAIFRLGRQGSDATRIRMSGLPGIPECLPSTPAGCYCLPIKRTVAGEDTGMPSPIVCASRRRFLQYLAGSPLLASGALTAYGMEAAPKLPDPMMWAPPGSGELINRPKDAINVFEFEPVARRNVPPAHFGYMASGIDDEVTLRANREDFLKFQLMPRRLNDVSKVDTSIELFGTRY